VTALWTVVAAESVAPARVDIPDEPIAHGAFLRPPRAPPWRRGVFARHGLFQPPVPTWGEHMHDDDDLLPLHPTLKDPRTGEPLRAFYRTKRGELVWPVMGGSQPTGEPAQ